MSAIAIALALITKVATYAPAIVQGVKTAAEILPEALAELEKLWSYLELAWGILTGKIELTPEVNAQILAADADMDAKLDAQFKLREAEAAALSQGDLSGA